MLHTLVSNEINQDVNHDERARPANTSRAVHHNGPWGHPFIHQRRLAEVHILQKAKHCPWVMGHPVVRPGFEVVLENVASFLSLLAREGQGGSHRM